MSSAFFRSSQDKSMCAALRQAKEILLPRRQTALKPQRHEPHSVPDDAQYD